MKTSHEGGIANTGPAGGTYSKNTRPRREKKVLNQSAKLSLQEPGRTRAMQSQRIRNKNKINMRAEINKNQREKQ